MTTRFSQFLAAARTLKVTRHSSKTSTHSVPALRDLFMGFLLLTSDFAEQVCDHIRSPCSRKSVSAHTASSAFNDGTGS